MHSPTEKKHFSLWKTMTMTNNNRAHNGGARYESNAEVLCILWNSEIEWFIKALKIMVTRNVNRNQNKKAWKVLQLIEIQIAKRAKCINQPQSHLFTCPSWWSLCSAMVQEQDAMFLLSSQSKLHHLLPVLSLWHPGTLKKIRILL